jgi:UDP-N-acetylglucosamine 4-epimerase
MYNPHSKRPTTYDQLQIRLRQAPARTWLITGVAGFIGSHLLETLLRLEQQVVGLDNFSTGSKHNLAEVQRLVTPDQWSRFRLIKGDIRTPGDCRLACKNVDHVLHQAALGSVPRSLADPISAHTANTTGFLNMLVAARDAKDGQGISSFTYATSSAIYGDHPGRPQVEETTGQPLSPEAVTKYINELYAEMFARCYGFNSIGLRYFNVFGPRQDPHGAYAAVIPKWATGLLRREPIHIHGDGETSRDFCFVANVVQANLLAATTSDSAALNQVYNVAVGERTSLNSLFAHLLQRLHATGVDLATVPTYREFRPGDVRHSQADISKAQRLLGYAPSHNLTRGLAETLPWFVAEHDAVKYLQARIAREDHPGRERCT